MSLVKNEQTKLTAIAVGVIVPGTAAMLGTGSANIALLVGTIWLAIGSILHFVATAILRKLVE